jgi:3,4-dihydroxyphenylacetate 2,3-dioxygenase
VGAIVGAAVVSHVPPIVMSEADRRSMNGGQDISLVPGLRRLRAECLDRLRPDTVIVIDTHWFTTFEHIVTAHERRHGLFTSEELPRTMSAMPFDIPGDPELADAIAAQASGRPDTWIHASRDPHLPVHYPTTNLLPYLQRSERWMSASICQTATPEDFLLFGQLIGAAAEALERRVVILASGGMSHRFWPLRELRQHEAAGTEHIVDQTSVTADLAVIAAWEHGDHASVIDGYHAYRAHKPEGMFGHYMVMVGAIGASDCTAAGVRYSEYEAAAGTGQVHVWFECPAAGWTA